MTSTSEGLDSSVVVTMSVLCVLGIISNVLVMVVTGRKTDQKKTATDIFIVNLALSDVILGGVTLPLIMIDASFPDFTNNDMTCKIKMSLPLFNIMTSIATMVAISFERMRVIVRKRQTSMRQALWATLAIWVVSLVTTAPQWYEYRVVEKWEEEENRTETTCSSAGVEPLFIKVYAAIVLVVSYLLPMLLVTHNYTHVIVVISQAARQAGSVSRHKVRVLGVLIALTAVFALLWLPYFVLFVNEELTGTDDSSLSATTPHVIKHTFVALSAVSNPIIYICFLPEFRRGLAKLCSCRYQVTPDASGQHSSHTLKSSQKRPRGATLTATNGSDSGVGGYGMAGMAGLVRDGGRIFIVQEAKGNAKDQLASGDGVKAKGNISPKVTLSDPSYQSDPEHLDPSLEHSSPARTLCPRPALTSVV